MKSGEFRRPDGVERERTSLGIHGGELEPGGGRLVGRRWRRAAAGGGGG